MLNRMWFSSLEVSCAHCWHRAALQQYLKPIIITLLTRMQTSKTDKYVYLFSKFLLYTMAINVDGLGPDTMIAAVESIQPG